MPDTLNADNVLDGFTDTVVTVGIGASAGGIQAIKAFFEKVPVNTNIAYVVILHLSPNRDGKLAEVLRSFSRMPVVKVIQKVKVVPNHIYVIPPDRHLLMADGHIAVSPNLDSEDSRAPVDIFFRTLAASHGPAAVCVVLSGTGGDGSTGLKRIKELGGAVFVQSPREAEYNEMPRNAISTGLVDAIMPVADIPSAILAYRNNLASFPAEMNTAAKPEENQNALLEIFTQLRLRTGHDFTNYKRPTLVRRIERRVMIKNLPNLTAYAGYLQQNAEEVHALLKDMLISVTNFFRDKKAFEAIQHDVLPRIIKDKNAEDQVRIWVAGCATGEEAYSIAMLCAEQTLNVIDAPKIQIFATDIDEPAITHARSGYYSINETADVTQERLRRFFNKEGDGYRVRREIREMVLFANHNFIKDPPFSHLDMISCRNVLIYLTRRAQERVMETFHFALNTGGYLLLGTSESIDASGNLYEVISRDDHIYKSRQVALRAYPLPDAVPILHIDPANAAGHIISKPEIKQEHFTYGHLHQLLLEQYAPPSLVVNQEYDIVHLSERAVPYLQLAGGEPSQNLLKLIRPEMRLEMRSALYQAVQQQTSVEARGLRLEVDRKIETINIHVRPVLRKIDDNVTAGYILVIFERTASTTEKTEHAGVILRSDESVSRHLEEELARMKMQLRTSSEQHEFQAEELKASNEELQAMNEELRSAAEELETSKEELQSMNEELRTVNQELKVKIEETTLTSNNLQNLINSANIGTIFLDRSFRVAMFTPAVRNVFNLIPADNGRPLTDITHKLENDTLLQDAEQVLDRLTTIEREVKTTDSHWFIMRVLPYRTAEDHINGVVITFTDITSRKEAENKVQEFREKMQKAFSIETVGIIFFHTTGKITDANDAFLAMCGYSREDLKANRITWDTITPAEFLPQSKHALEQIQREGRNEPYERQYMRKDGARCWGLFSGTRINKDEAVKFVVDITAQKLLQQQKDEFIAIASHELKTPVTSIKVYTEVLRNMFHATGDKEHTELMEKLDAQVDRLNTLIKDLLDNDNIAEGKLVLKKELTDINALVLRHVEEMQRVAARHCIIFTPQKLPLINADRERIAQVLTNLIFNAIKYSPEGGDVIITAYQRDKEITVSVKDSGIGIPALDIEHVFDRFFRTNHVPSQNFPGMGLGLYISAGIIQRHNGKIGVSSKEGEGSTFWFTLPVN